MAKLYFKFGAMKCGKTTDIIKTYYNYKEKDLNVLINDANAFYTTSYNASKK